MTESPQQPHLKNRVRLRTKSFLVAGAAFLTWANFGLPTSIASVAGLDAPAWITNILPALLSIFVMVMDSLPGEHAKAALVFWRLRNPLPGTRAFTRDNLDRDPRIDKGKLRAVVGGELPRWPREQNSTWYGLYRSVEADPRVQGVHTEYLILRDLTWFSVVLLLASVLSLAIGRRHAPEVGAVGVVLALLYFLLQRAASERGHRFVNTVLAVVCTSKT